MIRKLKVAGGLVLLMLVGIALAMPMQSSTKVVGTVIASRGEVMGIADSGKSRLLKRRSEVLLGETIVTKESGYLQFRLKDGTLISIKPNTKYVVEEFQLDPTNAANNKYVGRLLEGVLISLSGRGESSTHRNHIVKTPVVSIAIRGTMFEVSANTTKLAGAELEKYHRTHQDVFSRCGSRVHLHKGTTVVMEGALRITDSKGQKLKDLRASTADSSYDWAMLGCEGNREIISMLRDNKVLVPVNTEKPKNESWSAGVEAQGILNACLSHGDSGEGY